MAEKKRVSQKNFYNPCGTLIWLRSIAVKFDRNLTRVIRTYTIIHIKAKLFMQAFMHLCLVRLWLLSGGEKTVESNTFFKILWYVNMGEDYANETRSAFNWNNPHLYNYLHPLLFYKTVGFFHSRLNVEVQVNFSPQFYVHINAKLFIHAFMHLCLVRLWLLCGGEKTGELNTFYNSSGTSIWVRIMPVKLHWSLTGIIRTYTIIYILYCSTKPLVFFSLV